MDLGLKDKVAIVTGSGNQIGYGKGIALTLAKEGCHVVVVDINFEGAKQTAAEIKAIGPQSMALKVDITKRAEVEAMVKAVLDKFGQIDILVNNAGCATPPKPFIEMTEKDWDLDMSLNLKGTVICTKAVVNHMIARRSGKIINVSSPAGLKGRATLSLYSAAKAGVIAFTQALAAELEPSGINVNSVLPSLGTMGFPSAVTKELGERVTSEQVTGKIQLPQDIGDMVSYLASDITRHVVGQSLGVMGKAA